MSPSPVQPYTLEAWFEKFLAFRPELSDRTRKLYRDTFSRLTAYFGANRPIESIRRLEAAEFVVWLRTQHDRRRPTDEKLLSPTTVARHVRDCKALFRTAVNYEVIPSSPFAMERSSAPATEDDWYELTLPDLDRLLAVAPTPGWRALWALCRLAGLRRGEALRLEWSEVSLDAASILVRPPRRSDGSRVQTNKHRRRDVPIRPELATILSRVRQDLGEAEPLVCPVVDQNLYRDACVQLRRAGLPEFSKPFHTLRKCLASEWLAEHPIMDVCRWLGHHPNVAARHYHRPTAASFARVTGRTKGEAAVSLEQVTRQWADLPENLRRAIAAIVAGGDL